MLQTVGVQHLYRVPTKYTRNKTSDLLKGYFRQMQDNNLFKQINKLLIIKIYRSGQYIVSGNSDGTVLIWDTNGSLTNEPGSSEPCLQPCTNFVAHGDCVNGVRLVKLWHCIDMGHSEECK